MIGDASVDLHGMDVRSALDEVERAIQSAFMHRDSQLRIIHGRGSGRLRDEVHRMLAAHKLVEGYEDDPTGGALGGATFARIARR